MTIRSPAIRALCVLVVLAVTGCATHMQSGQIRTRADMFELTDNELLLDDSYFLPSACEARRYIYSATETYKRIEYSEYYDCDDLCIDLAQKIRRIYSRNPKGAQTVAVSVCWIPKHCIVKILTTDGPLYFEYSGEEIEAPKEIIREF